MFTVEVWGPLLATSSQYTVLLSEHKGLWDGAVSAAFTCVVLG